LNVSSATQASESANLARETSRKTIQEVSNLKTTNEQTTAIIKNLGEEYQNLVKQGWNLGEIGNQLRASVKLMSDQSDQIGALMRLTDWDSKLREQQGKLTGFDVQGAQSMGNLGRSFKEAGPMLELILRALTRR
jgi:methyl-accepting chemotaxis protein